MRKCGGPRVAHPCFTQSQTLLAAFVSVIIDCDQCYLQSERYVDWGLVVKLALPAKVTRRANKVTGIYDRSH
jgi:hypothetical protein